MLKKQYPHNLDIKSKSKPSLKSKFIDQQTSSDTPKKISFKSKFIQWLKDLPLDQRYLAVKVHCPGLAHKIQQKLIDFDNSHNEQLRKDSYFNKRIPQKLSKQILDSIVLISDGQQFHGNIGFDFIYVQNPQKLYDLLISSLNQTQKQSLLSQQFKTIQLNQIIQIISNSQSREELLYKLIEYLRFQIFLRFQQNKFISIEQQRNRKKQFSMYWRALSQEYKIKILLLFKQDIKGLLCYLNEKAIQIQLNELEKQYNQLLKLDKNQFCNRIFKCKLRRSLTYVTEYHGLVYKVWKQELIKKKKRTKNNYLSTKMISQNHHQNKQHKDKVIMKIQACVHLNSNQLIQHKVGVKKPNKQQNQQKNTEEIIKISHKRKRIKNRGKKSTSAESKQTKATKCIDEIEKQQKIIEQSKNQLTLDIENSNLQSKISTASSNFNPEEKRMTFKIDKIDYQAQIMSKICFDIQEYSDLINQEANQFQDRRVIAYERIQFLLGIWQIPIKLFGSCASGITIKNSDIDIAVDSKILEYFVTMPENQRLKAALEQLETFFQQQPWVTSLKLIKTAAIPLIKMKVNTSISFIDIPNCPIHPTYLQTLNRPHSSSGQIHIDLTIQTRNKQQQSNHLGVISTECINKWLYEIKTLHPIIILIKNYLTNLNLNITYEGGLNTYSMICMIVAFMLDNHLENQNNVAEILKKLVKFYAFEFDEQMKGIDLENQHNIFYDKIQLKMIKSATQTEDLMKTPELTQSKSVVFCKADLEIKDPLNNGKNMTKNCYSFPKIKQMFKRIHQQCFQLYEKRLQRMFQDQWQAKRKEWSNQKVNEIEMKSEVRQLIKKCKDKIGNPFLTLFG